MLHIIQANQLLWSLSLLSVFNNACGQGMEPRACGNSLYKAKYPYRYHVVFPLISPGQDEDHKSISFTVEQDDLTIKLVRNRNITAIRSTINDGLCPYYQGFIKGSRISAGDYATLSVCTSLRGILRYNNSYYFIEKMEYDIKTENTVDCIPHKLTPIKSQQVGRCKNKEVLFDEFTQLHKREYYERLRQTYSNSQTWESSASWLSRNLSPKRLRIAFLVDQTLFAKFNYNMQDLQLYLLDVVNVLDKIYQTLNIRITLQQVTVTRTGTSRNLKTALQDLLIAVQQLQRNNFDVVHLLSGEVFDGGSAGLAVPDSICSSRSAAVVSAYLLDDSIPKIASVIAHMLGHNIGLQYDSSQTGCECMDLMEGCIMSDTIKDHVPTTFSLCSVRRMELISKVALTSCLSDQSAANSFQQICGNGIIERGEQCDCGPLKSCKDECCNATTCLLQSWATCKSESECCSGCIARSNTTLCREAKHDCDAAEFCDGIVGKCPEDEHIQDGQPCNEGQGYCYQGQCPSMDGQCENLWGPQAKSAVAFCYKNNLEGTQVGHCGHSAEYRKCNLQDAPCGLLQCMGGQTTPVIPTVNYGENSYVTGLGEVSCKTANGPPHLTMIADGTKCASNMICMSASCVAISTLGLPSCPVDANNQTCSGKGRCTRDLRCSCNEGFTGVICDVEFTPPTTIVITTQFIEPATFSSTKKLSGATLISVGSVMTLSVLIIAAVYLLYRRRKGCFNQSYLKKKSTNGGYIQSLPSSYISYSSQGRLSDDSSVEEEEDREGSYDGHEYEIPIIIHDVPLPTAKGILKKPSNSFHKSEGMKRSRSASLPGSSSCSCSESCSCSQSSSSSSSEAETEDNPEQHDEVPRLPSPEYNFHVSATCMTTAVSPTDSAIDTSASTLSDTVLQQNQPQQTQPLLGGYYNCRTMNRESFSIPAQYSSNDSISNEFSYKIPLPRLSSQESLEENEVPVHSNDSALESMYSKRPEPGPLRTFKPIRQPKESQLLLNRTMSSNGSNSSLVYR